MSDSDKYDAIVIGGDNDAGGKLGKFGAFVDALNHAGTSQRYQGFTGQAGGTVASWDNDDDVGWAHKNFPLRQNGCTKLHFVCNKFLCERMLSRAKTVLSTGIILQV